MTQSVPSFARIAVMQCLNLVASPPKVTCSHERLAIGEVRFALKQN
jgi:hypothetical protein